MIFNQFYKKFKITQNIGNTDVELKDTNEDFRNSIKEIGGKTFNNGLYRVYRGDQLKKATDSMIEVFPELNRRIICFAYDWLGRHFAIDFARQKNNNPLILLLEPGAGESMQIPVSIIDFHNDELVNYTNDALAIDFFEEWFGKNNKEIKPHKCIGYKIPLFLGGTDTIDNLELIDIDVYLHLCGQLRQKAIALPDGTIIHNITIS